MWSKGKGNFRGKGNWNMKGKRKGKSKGFKGKGVSKGKGKGIGKGGKGKDTQGTGCFNCGSQSHWSRNCPRTRQSSIVEENIAAATSSDSNQAEDWNWEWSDSWYEDPEDWSDWNDSKALSLKTTGRIGMIPGMIGMSTQTIGQMIGTGHRIQLLCQIRLHCQAAFRSLRLLTRLLQLRRQLQLPLRSLQMIALRIQHHLIHPVISTIPEEVLALREQLDQD